MRRPVWTDIYDAYRRFVDPTEDAYERPWCGLCAEYAGNHRGFNGLGPASICDADCYDGGLRDSTMFRRYWAQILDRTPSNTVPCTWCGFRAAAWCESCDRSQGPASALCLRCENELAACRLCCATNYVKNRDKPKVQNWIANQRKQCVNCSWCGTKPATQRCARCMTIPYCSRLCQKGDWPQHKNVCNMLRNGCEVFCTYEWQQRAKEACLAWAVARGEQERYYKCFGQSE